MPDQPALGREGSGGPQLPGEVAVASALGGFQTRMVHPTRAVTGQGAGFAGRGMLPLNSHEGQKRAAGMPAPAGAGGDAPCFPLAGREWCLRGG